MIDFSKRISRAALASLVLLLALTGCDGGSATPPARTTTSVGVEGGTVNGPDGVQVVIPAGALDKPTEIGVSNDGSGATEIGGVKSLSKVYAVTPHGTEFAQSARISLPFNPPDVAAGGKAVIVKSQPGGTWTALSSEVVGSTVSADISGFSYYAVGTCFTSRDVLVPGPDPLIACPSAHSLKLELLDNSGVALPVVRNSNGAAIPVLTITEPAQIRLAFRYSRPSSGRLDHMFVVASGAVAPGDWPRDKPLGGPNDTPFLAGYQTVLTFDANPSTVPNAYRDGGALVRFRASVTTQMDAFYLGCLCFKPASWTYEAEVPVRVIFAAPPVVTHTVGGTVSGLTGAGLVLRNNGANNLSVAANAGAFTFSVPVTAGSAYNVTVFAQPAGQTCTVTNGSGTANAAVTSVAVACVATATYTIGGSVTGLTGTGLVLGNNGAGDLAVAASATAFTFATPVNAGRAYNVTVFTQPAGQTCTVANGAGTANANVSNVVVTCVAAGAGPLVIVANSGVSNGTNGLAVYRASPSTGQLSFVGNANAGNSPFAVVVTPNGQYAYVSNQQGGSVSSYSVNSATGVLSPIPLSSLVSNNASGIAMDRLGRFIWVANYGFHTVSAFSIGANGVLTAAGSPLSTNALPYVIAAHPTLDKVYVAHQAGSAVNVYNVNTADGTLTHQQTLTNVIVSANGLVIDPTGRFAYAVSGNGGVCAFIINSGSGNLSKGACAIPPGGSGTFSVAIHPSGQYLYTTNDSTLNNVAIFSINQTTGALTQFGSPVTTNANPRGVAVGPGGNYLYVTSYVGNSVEGFSIGAGGGSLTSVGASNGTGNGSQPVGIAVTP